jgi:urease accessory protein
MRRIEHDAAPGSPHHGTLTLPFELRQKSRLRVRLDGGDDVALSMARGRVLRGGDLLRADDGTVVLVRAAAEQVSTVTAAEPEALARAAYHLGNRHVPVQVGAGFLRYQHDHVLDDMVRALGVAVHAEQAPFEPEGGAYAHASTSHDHDDPGTGTGAGHSHGHSHGHGPGHRHGHDR